MTGPSQPAPALNPLALPMLGGAYFMLGVGSLSPIGLVGAMSRDLEVSAGSIAFLMSAFALTYAAIAPVLQMLIGHWDRRLLVIIGLGKLAVGALICMIAPNYAVVIIGRMVMAVGCALIGPMVTAAAASIVPTERQGRAIALVLTGLNLSSVLGIPLASLIGDMLGWRVVMALIAAACGLVILALRLTVPTGSFGTRTTAAAMGGVALDPVLGPALLTTFFHMAANFAIYSLVGVFLVSGLGMPESFVPPALLILGVASLAGVAGSMHFMTSLGPTRLIAIGLCGFVVTIIPFQFSLSGNFWTYGLFGMWMLLNGLAMAPQAARLAALAGKESNLVMALNSSLLQLGGALGSAIAGVVQINFGAAQLPKASLVLIVVAIGLFAISLRVARRARAMGK